MKTAIVCDWLVGIGGAERVVLELHKMYPDAPIFTSQYDPSNIDWFKNADIRTGWLQKLPKSLRKFLPPLRALWFSRLNLEDYDLVLSSSGAEAKGVKTAPGTLHINYCHSPTHYYWVRYDEYLENPGFGIFNPLARFGLKILVGPMRRWDKKAAQRPSHMIANSSFTKANIKKYYGRDSVVINPPVDIERFKLRLQTKRKGFITAGRQVPYKRLDLAVSACSQLNLPLTVLGNGPEHNRLVKLAGPSIKFVTDASDKAVANYFSGAEAFIFPGQEDFGIVAVEALAAGTPIIAYKAGGALDFVKPGDNGEFFDSQTVDSLAHVLASFNPSKYAPNDIKKSLSPFSQKNFQHNLREYIQTTLN